RERAPKQDLSPSTGIQTRYSERARTPEAKSLPDVAVRPPPDRQCDTSCPPNNAAPVRSPAKLSRPAEQGDSLAIRSAFDRRQRTCRACRVCEASMAANTEHRPESCRTDLS